MSKIVKVVASFLFENDEDAQIFFILLCNQGMRSTTFLEIINNNNTNIITTAI